MKIGSGGIACGIAIGWSFGGANLMDQPQKHEHRFALQVRGHRVGRPLDSTKVLRLQVVEVGSRPVSKINIQTLLSFGYRYSASSASLFPLHSALDFCV
jgi:hypothetical protein